MSRRKQLNPRHLESEQILATSLLPNDDALDSQSEEEGGGDEHVCGRCRAEFVELADFLGHKKKCTRKRIVVIVSDEFGQDGATSDQEDLNSFSTSSYYRDLEYNGDMANQKRNEDLENNNSVNYEKELADGKADDDGDTLTDKEMMVKAGLNISGYSHVPSFPLSLALSDSNVSLEVLHNTKVAVAQFPLSNLANANGLPPQDLVVLQSTLYTLQQQQLLQLQLIQQLQHQLESQKPGSSSTNNTTNGTTAAANNLGSNGNNTALNLVSTSAITSTSTTASASSMATSSIELNQPNSLELLQRSAQQVLNNASQGLLANGLDFSKGKTSSSNGSYESKSATSRNEEPFFKHRCRFCGKVFGSDSALQIHIRSHTGERPFKCNVCGNRFSTKGNLKVHFQRHKVKYPHIKMNPNPVPEHLDRFHPPLMPHEAPQYRSNGPPERSSYPGLSSSPLPPQLSRQSPILGPLDLGHKPPSIAPTLLPTLPNESNLVPLRRNSESPASVSKVMTPSEDSRENSMERSLSPAMSMKSEERAKSASPTNIDESSKDSMTLDKRDGGMSPLDLPKISVASSPTTPSRHHHHHHHHHHPHHHPHHHSHHHSHHSHIPITSFSSLIPMTSTPTTFSNSHSLSTLSAASALHMSTLPLTEPALDPAVYTPLLPKPGSNDNSWESLIEITKTSETSKLQQLVDNIEHKLSDPNQCVICHRVLSCKSALQMHYRTHTGERPFKCKICGRAFTTKGNLKTHMGVHRAKPPMRVLHQCPVCHKKFTNALVLQQHIRMHTGEPTELSPEQIQAAEIKDYPPTLHPALPHLMHSPTSVVNSSQISLMPSAMMKPSPLPPSLMSPGPHASDMRTSESESVIKSSSSLSEGEKSSDGESVVCKQNSDGLHGLPASAIVPTFSTSLAALENHVKAINTIVPSHLSNYGNLMNLSENLQQHDDSSSLSMNEDSAQNGDKSPDMHRSSVLSQRDESPMDERSTPSLKVESPSPGVTASTVSHTVSAAHSPASVISVATSESFMAGALDLTPKTSVITSVGSDSISIPNSFPGLPLAPHLLNPNTRLSNTTCNICFKTFACNSALEIHYRSHTKERPFKCNACDRAFSTKGNMKQHMLTHKIRDLPPQLFDSSQSNLINAPRQQQQHQHQYPQQHQQQQQHSGGESVSNSPGASPTNVPNSSEQTSLKRPHQQENNNSNNNSSNNNNNNNESPLPLPKRPPGLPKHLCHVCHKNFSSASALQIHMRTHTGDKPFKCTICERAFTTKGNLKVHMGTHMWNNGTSRRGRRMSIELPPIPLTAKDSEFMQRRPDLYFPFMAAPFMNGLATKVNEISVIQSAAMNNGGLTSPPMGIVPVGSGISDMSPLVKCSAPSTTPTSTPSSTPLPELDLSVKKTPSINDHHSMLPSTCKPPQHSPQEHDDQPADMSKNTSWVWKLACNLCSKVCSSPTELEHHLQAHYNMEMKSDAPPRSSPHPENLAV